MRKPLISPTTQVSVLESGDGPLIQDGQQVDYTIAVYYGANGQKLSGDSVNSARTEAGLDQSTLNRAMDWNLPDEEATTVAGLVIHEARIIPEPGQAFTFHGFRFQVLRKNRNRITALRITPLAKVKAEGPAVQTDRKSG